jgi:hypothetical protein
MVSLPARRSNRSIQNIARLSRYGRQQWKPSTQVRQIPGQNPRSNIQFRINSTTAEPGRFLTAKDGYHSLGCQTGITYAPVGM